MSRRNDDPLRSFVCVVQRRETDDFIAPLWWTRFFNPGARQDFVLAGSTVEVETPIGVVDVAVEVPKRTAPSGSMLTRMAARRRQNVELGQQAAQKRRGVETAPDEQGMLHGRIFVLPRQKRWKRRKLQERWLAELRKRLRDKQPKTYTELEALLPDLTVEVAESSPRSVPLEFALFRTGEVRIWLEDAIGANMKEEDRRVIARQSYFFIKDMVHHHVHHDSKSDQITPLTEIGTVDAERGEELWRRDTVWSLSRAVDALARRGKLQDLREATGILAYADAFQNSLLLYRRQAADPTMFEPNAVTYRYDFKHIRESLKVQLDQVSGRRTTISQMVVAGLAGSLAATSLLASAVSAFNSAGDAASKKNLAPVLPGIYRDWLQSAADFYIVPTILVGAFLFFVSKLVLSEDRIGTRREPRRKLAQGARGIFNSIAKRLHWNGKAVQRCLEWFYLLVLVGLGWFTYAAVPYVIGLAKLVSNISVTISAPLEAGAAPKAKPPAGPAPSKTHMPVKAL